MCLQLGVQKAKGVGSRLSDQPEPRVRRPEGEGLVELIEDVASQVRGLNRARRAEKGRRYAEPHLPPCERIGHHVTHTASAKLLSASRYIHFQ